MTDALSFPLSYPQQRLWALDRIEPGSATYNIASAVRIAANLRTGPLWRALHAVVARHESLRTTFAIVDEEPRQCVRDGGLDVDEIDLSRESHSDVAAREILRADAFGPFDLARGPLVRAKLLKLAANDWVFYLNVHHIVADEWSLSVILRDLIAAYEGAPLPPLPMQYRDFAARQRAWMQSRDAQRDRAYWKEKLGGLLPVLDLPCDSPRPAEVTHRGASLAVTLDADLSAALLAVGRNAGATAFRTLTALTKLLLHRITGQEDIVVGAPVLGRDDADLEEQVGFFINMLVLRDVVRGQQSFLDLLASVNATVQEAHEHARYPFDLLVNELEVERDLGRSPLFDVAVILQDRESAGPASVLPLSHFDFGFVTAKYDLSVYFVDSPRGIELILNYNTDLFRRATIARMAGHFEQLAREVVRDTAAPMDELEIVSEPERRMWIETFNATACGYLDKTLVDLFEEQVERTPENIAVISGDTVLTYRQLNERSNGIARCVREHVAGEELVAVLLESSDCSIATLLGVLKAGCAYVPLDPIYPPERLRFMLDDCGARLLLSEPACVPLVAEVGAAVKVIDVRGIEAESENLAVPISPGQLAYVIYTSGSTGRPKGCCITHRNVVRLLKNDRFPFDFGERDVWIVAHSFCFDFSVWEMYGALLYGGSVVVPRREEVRDVDEFLRLLRRHRVTVLNQTPAAFYNLAEREAARHDADLDSHLRIVVFGGDRLDPARLRRWTDRYPLERIALVNMFGITETTVHVTVCRLREEDIAATDGRSPVGVPLPETTVYVLNPAGRLQPPGITGEIYVGGSGVGRGYLNREQLTAERFVESPFRAGERLYRSGDLGRLATDGTLEHLGRNDTQVQVRGFRVELGEVERALLALPGMRNVVVLARDGGDGVKDLVAWIVGDDIDPVALRGQLRRTLPDYMIPAHFVAIDDLPLTTNNKIDVKALPPPGASRSAGTERTAPSNSLERALVAIWERVLGVSSLSVSDNYFNVGGDSIKVIRLITAIGRELGVRLEVKDVFRHTTIVALAAHIRTVAPHNDDLATAAAEVDALKHSIAVDDGWEDVYSMSDIEQGMIFHSLLDGGMGVYHLQFVYPIEDDAFDPSRFERALQLLVEKHPILRTSFRVDGFAEPVQVVHRERAVALPLDDFTSLGAEEQERALLRFFEADRAAPFDVAQPGLWRARLARLSERRHAMLWSFHHAILDGWSNASFLSELMATYAALERDPAHRPAPLRATVRDFVVDQRRWRRSSEVEAFWREELDGWERMGAPFGRALDSGASPGTRRQLTRHIETAVGDALAALSRRESAPIRDVYLAAFAELMELVTGKRELLFGIVADNRPAVDDGDAILGCFLNSVPFRTVLPFPRTPRDLLRAMRTELTRLAPHERLSMRRIAELRGVSGEPAPFFDVLFNFVDFHVLQESTNDPILVHGSTNTSFDFSVSGTFGIFSTTISASGSLFSDADLELITEWYFRILERFTSAPDAPLANALIAADERVFNDTARDYPCDATIAAVFSDQVKRAHGADAVCASGKRLTYRQLDARANGLARALRQRGVGTDDCVAILVERSELTVIAFLGVLKAGGAYVPLDPDWPRERIDYVLRDTGCRIVLTDADIDTLAIACDEHAPAIGNGTSLAYVNYTSGSTGKPKGSLIEQHSVLRLVLNTNYVDLRDDDRVLQAGSVAFDACTFEVWGALLNGGCVVVPERSAVLDATRFARLLVDERITVLFLTTSLFNQFAEADARMFASLRVLLTGGEKASPHHFALVRTACPDLDLQNVYGPTENTTFSAFHRIGAVDGSVPIGMPIANTTIHLLNHNLQPLPAGVPGEICIGGEGVARGYVGDAELTAKKFVPDPFGNGGRLYRTGDLARRRNDGAIEFIGRQDRQVKIRGFRVEPEEIEQQILRHDAVAQAVVVARATTAGTIELVAYYVVRRQLAPETLRDHLAHSLPPYMMPAHFVVLDAMPISSTGKIDRGALPSPEVATEITRAPRDAREALLASLWTDVLGRESVGIDDNYFKLGGDSIRAIQVNSRLRRAGWRMEIRDLFLTPTIAQLAPKLVPAVAVAAQSAVAGPVPLTPIQRWFFEEHRGPLHHFTQPLLLRSRRRLDESALREALQAVWENHDQLRAVFRREEQIVRPPDAVSLEIVHGAMQPHAEQLLSALDLENGPLFKAVLYRLEDGDRILLVAHHLVVDAVSWRILTEDLERAYQHEALSPRSHSYAEWAHHLSRYAESAACRAEAAFWSSRQSVPIWSQANHYRDCRSDEFALTAGDAGAMHETLLTAFARALREPLEITLEHHGRTPLEAGLDVSRTVGWFTSLSPFALRLRGTDMSAQIENTRNALRSVPHDGIGYGVLRYLGRQPAVPLPRIAFNYLGQFDGGESSLFRISNEPVGRAVSAALTRYNDLDVDSMIINGSLRVAVTYDTLRYEARDIADLTARLRSELLAIAALPQFSGVAATDYDAVVRKLQ